MARAEGVPAGAEGARAPMFSPAGFVVLLAAMVVEGVAVWFVAGVFAAPPDGAPLVGPTGQKYVEVDLGQYTRELATSDALNMTPDRFILKIALVLNPKLGNVTDLERLVGERKNLFKHIISSDILHRMSDAELRKPNVLETLQTEIKKRVNAELPTGQDGLEVVDRVIFPQSELPKRR